MLNKFAAESSRLGSGQSSHFPRPKKPDKPAKIRSSSEPARPIQPVGAFRTRMHRNQGCSASSGAGRDAGQNLGIETTPFVAMATLGGDRDNPGRRSAIRLTFLRDFHSTYRIRSDWDPEARGPDRDLFLFPANRSGTKSDLARPRSAAADRLRLSACRSHASHPHADDNIRTA